MHKILAAIYFYSLAVAVSFVLFVIVVGVIGCTLYDCREFLRALVTP